MHAVFKQSIRIDFLVYNKGQAKLTSFKMGQVKQTGFKTGHAKFSVKKWVNWF